MQSAKGKMLVHRSALYVLPLLWGVLQGAPSSPSPPSEPSTEQPTEASALPSGCQQHFNEILAAVQLWQSKGLSEDSETQYSGLKERCQQAHEERSKTLSELGTSLPASMSSIVIAFTQLNITLKTELATLEATLREQQRELESAWEYGVELHRELLRTSVEADRIERALFYHAVLQNSSVASHLAASYAYHGENGRMVARLLKFVRALPARGERVEAYRELERLLKSNGQDERFPAVIMSQDVKQLGAQDEYTPDHAQLEGKAVARWQSLLLAGDFSEVAEFARNYPEYYAPVESDLHAALPKNWSRKALEHAIHLPNSLPHPGQRVNALRAVLEALLAHQDEQNIDAYLMQLASELEKLERALAEPDVPGNAEAREALGPVKELFRRFAYQREFSTYVGLYNMFKSAI